MSLKYFAVTLALDVGVSNRKTVRCGLRYNLADLECHLHMLQALKSLLLHKLQLYETHHATLRIRPCHFGCHGLHKLA